MAGKTFSEFQETVTLSLPNIEDKLIDFSEAAKKSNQGLVVEIAAIHSGLTANFNYYSTKELEGSVQSWVSPYPKPIILNHDVSVDPLGRVMAAKMDVEADGTPFTRLQVAITDPAAMQKVGDKRYLTGSVGGRSDAALCSVCGKDWAEASMMGPLPCKHARGQTYKGQLAYLERIGLGFKEYSFVNAPADSRSQVVPTSADDGGDANESDNEWVTPAHFFALNLDKEEIWEFMESDNRNVLAEMKKRESSPVYLSLKGAFLSTLAESEKHEFDGKENSTVDTEEDVLSVTEGLSEDLAGHADDEEVEESEEPVVDAPVATDDAPAEEPKEGDDDADEHPEDEPTPEEAVDEPDAAEDTDGERDEAAEQEEDVEEDEVEEAAKTGRPEAQEKKHTADVDSQFNKPLLSSPKPSKEKGADRTRESDEDSDVDEVAETDDESTGLKEHNAELERRVEELEASETAYLEENARLKRALHRVLAERVVEMKIALGIESAEDRDQLMADHVERSASSLADTIRDLSHQSATTVRTYDPPAMEDNSASIADDGSEIDGETSSSQTEEQNPEDLMVDVLMGRRPL